MPGVRNTADRRTSTSSSEAIKVGEEEEGVGVADRV